MIAETKTSVLLHFLPSPILYHRTASTWLQECKSMLPWFRLEPNQSLSGATVGHTKEFSVGCPWTLPIPISIVYIFICSLVYAPFPCISIPSLWIHITWRIRYVAAVTFCLSWRLEIIACVATHCQIKRLVLKPISCTTKTILPLALRRSNTRLSYETHSLHLYSSQSLFIHPGCEMCFFQSLLFLYTASC